MTAVSALSRRAFIGASATAGRAHPRCKCLAEAAFTVDEATYRKLFVGGRTSVDRRTPGINAILAGSTAAPTPPISGPGAVPIEADPGAGTAGAALPLTGAATIPLAAVGAGAVALGVLLKRAGRPSTVPTAAAAQPREDVRR